MSLYFGQPSYGANAFSQPAIPSSYPLVPPPPPMYQMDPATFRREFSNRLAELTVNSRPLIQGLSMMAHDYSRFADIVAQCIEAHIRKVSPSRFFFRYYYHYGSNCMKYGLYHSNVHVLVS